MEEPSREDFPSTVTGLASSSSSSSQYHEHYGDHHHHHHQQHQQQSISYQVNISISDAPSTEIRDEAWSCLVVLVTFWFFASMTLILGFYGSINLQLGPNCSRLLQASSLFVQEIKVNAGSEPKPAPMLYGFSKPPPLDVQMTWSEMHNVTVPINFHKEWIFFLNKGSKIKVYYNVKSENSYTLILAIAKGRESLVEWIEDPSYPNTTLSWNVIQGNGWIEQDIYKPSDYYIAVGNLNSEAVEVEMNFSIGALVYNTTGASYKCSLQDNICSLKLMLFGANAGLLTSPGPEQDGQSDNWYVKLSYGPRWITYLFGSGGMTLIILLAFKFISKFQNVVRDRVRFQAVESTTERTPLLLHKDDDTSSWGSSYESVSNDEDLEDCPGVASVEVKPLNDGENNTPRSLCAICFNSPRDCFFLPCGHSAACFTCGTRIAEDAGTCPICRRKMKKVRKIFTV